MHLINLINDLIRISTKHSIEQRLYNGDGLEIIYNLMGDARMTRWLTSISEETLVDEELWARLIKFLEKELNVQQEKALLQYKHNAKPTDQLGKNKDKNPSKFNVDSYNSNSSGYDGSLNMCHLCGECDHVQTKGPNGTLIVQYFACRKFAEMNPAQRFRELRMKGLCCQCLYPGAKQKTGKHASGTCQRNNRKGSA